MSKKKSNQQWKFKTGQHLIKKEEETFKIRYTDKQALKAGYVCGHVKEEQLLTIITPNRLETYKKKGFFKEVGRDGDLKFTKEARKFVAHHLGWENDSILNKKFFSLSLEERESTKSESEVRNELMEKAFFTNEDSQQTDDYIKFLEEQTSPVDFTYERVNAETGEVECVGFEAVTPNYTAEERQMKHNFAYHYGCKLEMRRS